jgi:hypothetical protein
MSSLYLVYICECLEFNGECFPVNMLCVEKLDVSVFLAKLDIPVCQIGVSGFGK